MIANLEAAGTSSETHYYSYTDTDVMSGYSYTYTLADVDFANKEIKHNDKSVTIIATDNSLPKGFSLLGNMPNPFNPVTNIAYDLYDKMDVIIAIYTMDGRQVYAWSYQDQQAGHYNLIWNGRDFNGNSLSSGVYICRIHANEFVESNKMLMLK
ncbi:MAG: T9SS type A sorting domain-containing protein [Candidatus Neomarinimicrobiota bacterium]